MSEETEEQTAELTAEEQTAKLEKANKARLMSFSKEKSNGHNKPFNVTKSHRYITEGDTALVRGTVDGVLYYKSYKKLETASAAALQLNQQYFD